MHNTTRRAVPLTWLLLNSQATVNLIANPIMMMNTRKVWNEDAICVYCKSGVKVMDRVGNLPGYGTVWYEQTGIVNIFFMLRATKKFQVVFDSEGGNFSVWSSQTGR